MKKHELPDGSRIIFRAYITLPNGQRLYAWQRDKRAFRLIIRDGKIADI